MTKLLDRLVVKKTYALSGDLAAFASPLAVVPPREETSGMLLGTDDLGRPVFLNPSSLPNMHGIIVGTTGSGKSTLARHLILEARDLGVSSWVIDPHGERSYARLYSRVLLLGADRINVLDTPGWKSSEFSSELARYIERVYGISGARFVLREILLKCLNRGSLSPLENLSEVPEVKRIYDDLAQIHEDSAPSVEELAASSICFTFPQMSSREFRSLAALLLLMLLQGYRRTLGESHRFEHMVVLEEAHYLAPYLLHLYQQTRKWGYSVIAVTQLPRELDPRLYQLAGFVVALSGPESYVNDISLLFSLTRDERDHILYKPRGAALLVRQGDPRPRKLFLKLRREAFPEA
ncbi:MAG: DUF87 domain-containing protein [Thermofilum sp.]|nr:DUF87 domain-containing protein [Thermofilum sp.]MCC6059221.1 DUF87 domain-containing protein [Thermofilum sp.]